VLSTRVATATGDGKDSQQGYAATGVHLCGHPVRLS
jgi:hypothetical protein